MKQLSKIITIVIILALSILPLLSYGKTIMVKGQKLENPYVMSRRPNGLEVGHKRGIMFVKFVDMPKDIQEKYNYDPAAARKYEADKLKQKQEYEREKQEKEVKEKAFSKEMDQRRFANSLNKLELDIKKTESRIAFLKSEIPRLQKKSDDLLNKTTSLAGTSVGGNNKSLVKDRDSSPRYNRGRRGHRYDGGYYVSSSNTAGNRAEYTKRRTIDKLEDEYSLAKKNLKKYQKELAAKEIDIIKMKQKLKRGRAKQK